MKIFTYPIKIDSAVIFGTMKTNHDTINFGKHDSEYKLLSFTNERSESDDLVFPVVSKDEKHWYVALDVIAGGKKLDLNAMADEVAKNACAERNEK